MREIIIPHDLTRGPVRAVRRMLVHSSIAEIQQLGLYDEYRANIDKATLEHILELIGPGWMPVELAQAHYGACNRLSLSDEQIHAAGLRAGEKMGSQLIVGAQISSLPSERSAWELIAAFSRMGRRMHEGGSTQYLKLGPSKLQIEHVGNPLFAERYYRLGHGGFMYQTFKSVGIDVIDAKVSNFRADKLLFDVTLTWK